MSVPAETSVPAPALLTHSAWRLVPQPCKLCVPSHARRPPGLRRVEASGCLPQPAGQKQPHPPASRMQACLQQTPAPDCGLSRVQNRTQGTDVHILPLPTCFLKKKFSEPAFINPPLSEEKRGPSLLRLRASGCPPSGGQPQAAGPCRPCLLCWLLA